MSGYEGATDRQVAYAQRLAERQARVGIIANTIEVVMPSAPPREVWTRWPKLRSARRREKARSTARHDPLIDDPILNGAALEAFARDIRQDVTSRVQAGAQAGAASAGRSGRGLQVWALFALIIIIASVLVVSHLFDFLRV
ncbi:MAG: hypothetical protein ACXIUW_15795 [Roseinatronobacter sp.]